jgi:hypothetical protein
MSNLRLVQEAATAKRSMLRNFLMHGFHALVVMVVGSHIRDTQCGFKVASVPSLHCRLMPPRKVNKKSRPVAAVHTLCGTAALQQPAAAALVF